MNDGESRRRTDGLERRSEDRRERNHRTWSARHATAYTSHERDWPITCVRCTKRQSRNTSVGTAKEYSAGKQILEP